LKIGGKGSRRSRTLISRIRADCGGLSLDYAGTSVIV
jgi:hypothetical protein